MPPGVKTRKARAASLQKSASASHHVLACVLLAFFAANASGQTPAKAPAPSTAPTRAQILERVEAQAQTYKDHIADVPLEVRQTIREYDGTGHLKKTRHDSYSHTFEVVDPKTGKPEGQAVDEHGKPLLKPDLTNGATLPFIFLPGYAANLSIRVETPKDGPWILHFKSNPCPPPNLHRRWMGADVTSQCVEGEAYLDPRDATITRIRMQMAGLPVDFRTFPIPLTVDVFQISSDTTFHMVKTDPGAPPRLVPRKAEYVNYTSRGRTVIEKVFEVVPANPQRPASL
jgi:hypothetical protein